MTAYVFSGIYDTPPRTGVFLARGGVFFCRTSVLCSDFFPLSVYGGFGKVFEIK